MKKIFLLFLALLGIALLIYRFNAKRLEQVLNSPSVYRDDEKYLSQKAARLKQEEPVNQEEKQSFCENIYLPWVPGSAWRYNVSSGFNDDILEIIIPAKENDNQFITGILSSSQWSFQGKINCETNGAALNNINFFRPISKINIITTPLDYTGFLVPKNLDEVTSWNFNLILKNESLDPNNPGQITQTTGEKALGTFRYLGEEELEITALGKITAQKIEAEWEIFSLPLMSSSESAGEEETNEESAETADESSAETAIKTPQDENQPAAFNQEEVNRSRERETIEALNCSADDCVITRKTARLTFWLGDQIGIIKSVYQEEDTPQTTLELRSFQIPAKK